MLLTRSTRPTTATIIAFPGTPAKDAEPEAAALMKRAWKATERLICALPFTSQAEQAKDANNLASFVGVLEQVALTAERTFIRSPH